PLILQRAASSRQIRREEFEEQDADDRRTRRNKRPVPRHGDARERGDDVGGDGDRHDDSDVSAHRQPRRAGQDQQRRNQQIPRQPHPRDDHQRYQKNQQIMDEPDRHARHFSQRGIEAIEKYLPPQRRDGQDDRRRQSRRQRRGRGSQTRGVSQKIIFPAGRSAAP